MKRRRSDIDYVLREPDEDTVFSTLYDVFVISLRMAGNNPVKAKEMVCSSMVECPERNLIINELEKMR
jgi:hypothetical protein